jgi:hypothetical protein
MIKNALSIDIFTEPFQKAKNGLSPNGLLSQVLSYIYGAVTFGHRERSPVQRLELGAARSFLPQRRQSYWLSQSVVRKDGNGAVIGSIGATELMKWPLSDRWRELLQFR